jgi:hypothetical protein
MKTLKMLLMLLVVLLSACNITGPTCKGTVIEIGSGDTIDFGWQIDGLTVPITLSFPEATNTIKATVSGDIQRKIAVNTTSYVTLAKSPTSGKALWAHEALLQSYAAHKWRAGGSHI